MHPEERRRWRLPLVAAAGPAVFVLVFLAEGWVRPGYSPLSQYVSALSLGPRGSVQVINFLLCGSGVLLLGYATWQRYGSHRAGRTGAVLLVVIGLGLFWSGPFVMDPAGTLFADQTGHGLVHGILGGIVFLLMPIVPFVLLGRLRPRRTAWLLTLILGLVTAVADIVFTVVTKTPDLATATSPYAGLIQRLVLIPFMVWLVVLGITLSRADRPGQRPALDSST